MAADFSALLIFQHFGRKVKRQTKYRAPGTNVRRIRTSPARGRAAFADTARLPRAGTCTSPLWRARRRWPDTSLASQWCGARTVSPVVRTSWPTLQVSEPVARRRAGGRAVLIVREWWILTSREEQGGVSFSDGRSRAAANRATRLTTSAARARYPSPMTRFADDSLRR